MTICCYPKSEKLPQLDKYIFIIQIKNLSVFFFFLYLYIRSTIIINICFLYKFKTKKIKEFLKIFEYWNTQLLNINIFTKNKSYNLYNTVQNYNIKHLIIYSKLKIINILKITKIFNYLKNFNFNNLIFISKLNLININFKLSNLKQLFYIINKNFYKIFKNFIFKNFNLNLFRLQQEILRYI